MEITLKRLSDRLVLTCGDKRIETQRDEWEHLNVPIAVRRLAEALGQDPSKATVREVL
jgi:hypothetical protein